MYVCEYYVFHCICVCMFVSMYVCHCICVRMFALIQCVPFSCDPPTPEIPPDEMASLLTKIGMNQEEES